MTDRTEAAAMPDPGTAACDTRQPAPRPWKITFCDGYSYIDAASDPYPFGSIATVWSPSGANAALIVRAVNAHDQLVRALRDAAAVLCDFEADDDDRAEVHFRCLAALSAASPLTDTGEADHG